MALQSKPCPPSWKYYNVTGFCYAVFHDMNWADAEKKCIQEGSHLASIHSEKEGSFVAELAKPFSSTYHHWPSQPFIGLFSIDNGTTWQWTDKTPMDYIRWNIDEPSLSNHEYCGQIWSSEDHFSVKTGQFNNFSCDRVLKSFLCKKLSSLNH
uniref:C-type lectin domain-containing protein n=1 Tax=Panagrolaimus davidi TaxID=227884 RepID=A0A914QQ10_9BILA